MGDEPTYHGSSELPGRDNPEETSADRPLEQREKARDHKDGWRKRARKRFNRAFPPVQSPSEGRLTSPLPGIIMFLFLLGVAALSILLIRSPAALPASAPADEFSAARALPYIQALATQPRLVGTSAHAEAEAYLIAQLRQLGLEPQVQKAVSVSGFGAEEVENVLARLPGSKIGGKAVLLDAHYDSVVSGPGASDDASGVATLLETARALKASNRPRANDVILFFEDGEEQVLKGSAAFVAEHPWAKDVGLVLWFDTPILTGPSYAGATPSNSWLIPQCAQAAPYLLASSFGPEIDQLLGDHSPDVFESAGYPELGFGSRGISAYYHTALDDAAHMDLNSLQHQGSYALSLVRYFGDLDLTAPNSGDALYFNVFGSHFFVHYPQGWIIPLLALAALVWVGALVFGRRWKQVSLRGVLLGALATVVVCAVLAVLGGLLESLVRVAYPQYDPFNFETGATTYNGVYYWFAFVALAMGLAALMHSGLRTRLRSAELAVGALLLLLALAVFASIALPGASYAFTWPLLFGSAGLWGWLILRRHGSRPVWRIVWLALLAVPALVLVVPLIYFGAPYTGIGRDWIHMIVLGLVAGGLAIHLEIMARPRKSWLPALMGLIMVGFLVGGHLTSDNTAARPLQDGIYYGLSADEGKAYWNGTFGTKVDPWTEQFLAKDGREGDYRNFYPWEHETTTYQASAPLTDLPVPQVEQLATAASGAFHLHVVPTAGTWNIYLSTMPGPVPGMTFFVNDKPLESDGLLLYWAPPAEGFDLTVEAPDLDTLTLRVVDYTSGLPALPGLSYTPRPAWIIPDANSIDGTAVAKTFTFDK
jgi:hypothetical protein